MTLTQTKANSGLRGGAVRGGKGEHLQHTSADKRA